MAKYYLLVIPVAIGIAAGMFGAGFLADESEPDTFTKQDLVQNGSPYEGNPSAPITIVEFGDYQCTYCMKFHQSSLQVIKDEYIKSGKANLVFRDFALNGPASIQAAEASHCAKDQGRFWEYHDEVYQNWDGENTGWVTRASLDGFAQNVGLDMQQFGSCMDSSKYRQQVQDTYAFGEKIGINATPSFLIISGDKIVKITGNQPIDVFRKTLDDL
ncbi:DsbA family protein [Candidatus Nitrosotenuis cloacae]|uniref:DsbA family protein n=1 Tax=Candidatus Nitrosotenuis cloacae TaxID=1603555 RepID=UPI002281E28D|nr:DsbA family protein [Candidatus Nitrosotenuis cloacae]